MAAGVFEEAEVCTALDVPLACGAPLQLSGLLLTTVYLEDIGLVGVQRPQKSIRCREAIAAGDKHGNKPDEAESSEPDYEVGAEEEAALAQLGLPTSFGARPRQSKTRSGRPRRGSYGRSGGDCSPTPGDSDAAGPASPATGNAAESRCASAEAHGAAGDCAVANGVAAPVLARPDQWQQAFDYANGCFYYYREASQETQWHATGGAAPRGTVRWPSASQRAVLEVPAELVKYWMQRYSLWSRYDAGVRMDAEAWFSATPEVVAAHHARRLACGFVVDAFTGAGGNAVQLAAACAAVLGIDTSIERLAAAAHNAALYSVAPRMDLVAGDVLALLPRLRQADAVFMSPPWGGPAYAAAAGGFDVAADLGGLGVGLSDLLAAARCALRPGGRGVAVFLPRNTLLAQVAAAALPGERCEVERCVLNGRLKAVTAYFGPLAVSAC
ncbi:hypothetical protein WJX81_004177 [Elliptochloris bilobata]|uniref:Trimethylguanosine synthase n=1 Tax=Elliptochloris bilobata TaxID=381761 RepID=A0AAW1RE88_9CHLO